MKKIKTISMMLLGLIYFNPFNAYANPIIKICYEEASVFPWTLADDLGLAIFELHQVEKSLNIKFEMSRLPWKRCQAEAEAGHIDGIFAASFSKKRELWGEYPTLDGRNLEREYRLHTDSFFVYINKKSDIKFENKKLINLQKSAVGVQLGYSVEADLKEAGYPTYSSFSSALDILKALSSNTFSAAVLQNYEALNTLNAHSEFQNIIRLEPAYKITDQYLVFNKSFYAKNSQLSLLIWKSIGKARTSLEYAELEKKMMKTIMPIK